MIIGDKKADVEVVGQNTSKKATISQDKMAKLQYLLTKGLYKDPQTAVIAEWTNNGVDSVVQAGKNPTETPVVVSIEKNKSNISQWIFSVEDKGVGLDNWEFENICMNYLESTKDQSNDYIGSFGIGQKSFLSLERPATFRCRKNGKERTYMVYEGEEFVNYDLISEVDTTEENGVKAQIVLNNWGEYQSFTRKAKSKLAYYDTVVLIIDGYVIDNKIFRNELFQWADLNDSKSMCLCLKDVLYEIDWVSLGIRSLSTPIALRFNLGEGITPTPSRESYITTEATKQLILKKIGEVATWFVKRYNNENKHEYSDFLEAYDKIDDNVYHVEVEKVEFKINELLIYSNEKIPDIKVKGVVLKSPSFYKGERSELLSEWKPVGYYSRGGTWFNKVKHHTSLSGYIFNDKNHPVLLSVVPVGNIKSYLKEKYKSPSLFIVEGEKRLLGTTKYNQQLNSYRHLLQLTYIPKADRRALIQEWQFVRDSISSTFIDETDLLNSQGYIDWLQKKKDDLKAKRMSPDYIGLNKKAGDVTIGYCSPTRFGMAFKKATHKVDKLRGYDFLTVMATVGDSINRVKMIAEMLQHNHKILFASVGKKEIKKIPENPQFITLNQFIMDSKPFKRLASAILFESVIDDFESLRRNREELFLTCLSTVEKDYLTLKKYVEENFKDTGDDEVKSYILQVAEDNNLFDKQLWNVYLNLKEAVKKYDFVTCLKTPGSYDVEAQKKYKRIIAQMLLFRKKYYNDLPENVVIKIEVIPDPVSEQKEGDEEEGEFEEEIDELNINLEEATI